MAGADADAASDPSIAPSEGRWRPPVLPLAAYTRAHACTRTHLTAGEGAVLLAVHERRYYQASHAFPIALLKELLLQAVDPVQVQVVWECPVSKVGALDGCLRSVCWSVLLKVQGPSGHAV